MADNTYNQEDTGQAHRPPDTGLLAALWQTFSSMRTAVILLLVLAVFSVLGTLIPQNAPEEMYIQKYGVGKYGFMSSVGLTDLYHSLAYRVLLTLMGINLAVCSINRFGIAWRRTFHPKVSMKPKQIADMQRSQKYQYPAGVQETAEKVITALRSRAYHITREQDQDDVVLHAARGRLSIWGPYLTHLSILVIFAGGILGRFGFNGYTVISEGEYADTYVTSGAESGKPLGFRVKLNKFWIEHDGQHNPTGYKSDLSVYDGGKEVARKTIDVNHPLTYKGVSFFQSDYGLSGVVLKITGPGGETEEFPIAVETGNGQDGKEYVIAGEPWRQIRSGGRKVTLFVHGILPDYVGGRNISRMPLNPAVQLMANDRFPEYRGLDAWTRLDWIPLHGSADYKGFKITLEKAVDYTGLQVASNSALPVVYTGFGLMLLGVFLSFYVTHATVRVRVSPARDGYSHVLVGATSKSDPSFFDRDFERLRDVLSG